MFCPKCGQQLIEGAKFCDKCGTPIHNEQAAPAVPPADQIAPIDSISEQSLVNQPSGQAPEIRPPEIYADYPQNAPEQPKRRKKRIFGKIIAIILIAVILLSGITVLGYYTFLPAKYTLWTAEYFTVQKAYNQLDSSWTRMQKKTDAVYNDSIKTDTEINFSIDKDVLAGNGLDDSTADMVSTYVKDMTLKFGGEVDMAKKKENLSLGLSYQNNPVVSLNGFIDGTKFGATIPELSQKSIVGEFKDLPRLADLYPENFTSGQFDYLTAMDPWMSTKLHDQIKIKHEDVKNLMQTYSLAFVNSLDASDMSIQRGQTTDLFGEDTKCQEVTIELNQKAQKDLLSSMLDTVKKDDNFYNLVIGNIVKVYNLMAESNPALKDAFSGVDLETALKRSTVNLAISQVKKSITADMLPQKVTVKAYIKGLDVVKYDIEIPVNDAGETFNLVLESVINGDSSKKRVTLSGDIEGDKLNAYIDFDKKYDKASDTQDTSVQFNMDLSGSTTGSINLKFENNQDPNGKSKVKQNTTGSLEYSFPDSDSKGTIGLTSEGTISRNNNGLQTGFDGTVNVNIDIPNSLQQPIKFALAVKNTTDYGAKIETPDWASGDNTIDLANASRDDLDGYTQELTDAVSSLTTLLGGY